MSGTALPSAAVSTPTSNDSASSSPLLTLGLLAGSTMENERRLPLHPHHLDRIDPDVRARMIVERGYAADFQLEPGYIESRVGRVAERAEVIASADILLLPKPQVAEVTAIPEGRILWGWPHCVQDARMTQTAIDRRLTLIAFEA
ncbi:MAG: alanine dehydrogenase, partial [Brachybacterium sp.]|nr:alanine dehydrogenase [Brachybacterium sp.]